MKINGKTGRLLAAAGLLVVGGLTFFLWSAKGDTRAAVVAVPGGRFMMGSKEGGEDILPHEQMVTNFFIGHSEVTVDSFADFLNATTNSSFQSPQFIVREGRYESRKGAMPVAWVSYDDAWAYCDWLSLRLGKKVRLPTEIEWEYAARGGIHGARFPWGWGDARRRARFDSVKAKRVCSFDPNPWGLYDMAGNVAEWCIPSGTNRPGMAIARGGSWADRDTKFLRVFHRVWMEPNYRDADVGFRILMESDEKPIGVQTNNAVIRRLVGQE